MRTSPVLLLLALACPAVLPADLAAQRKLTTLFAWDNGLTAAGAGAFFDLKIVPPGGIWITAIETNTVAALHTSMTVDVWVTPNTYVGNEGNASLWTKVASGHGNSRTVDVPTAITFAAPFHLAAGSWGMAVYHVDQSIRYTNATATNTVHSNADLTLTAGAARSQLFAGTLLAGRVWNGSIYYDVTPLPPSFVPYGIGCTGSAGVPSLAAQTGSAPKLGTTFTFSAGNLPATPGPTTVLLGASRTVWSTLNLPFDLSVVGMTGCRLYASLELTVPGVNTGGSGLASLPIPNLATLVGQAVYTQMVVPDASGNALGLTLTNAAQLMLGM